MRYPMRSSLPSKRTSRNNDAGFTLIEVMIVVAIVGILAAVAYPSYTDSVRKGKRAEARAALMSLLQQQERYFTQNNTYETFAVGAAGTKPFKDYSASEGSPTSSSHRLGARTCAATGGVSPTKRNCIEVFAQPQTGVYTDPAVTTLAIDSLSRKSCNDSFTDTAKCWK
jgi:type IV pilus assembly protein PilE